MPNEFKVKNGLNVTTLTASKPVFTDASKNLVSTGTLGVDQGGTGQTSYTDGQLLIGNSTGNTLTKATLTASTGISITNGSGSISIAATDTALSINNKTGAYTVIASDLGKIINCTSGIFTVSLTAAATLGAGFYCWIWNTSNIQSDAITIDPNGAETINGVSTIVLRRSEGVQIVSDGTNWILGDKKAMLGYAENFSATLTRASASGNSSLALGQAVTASGAGSFAVGTNYAGIVTASGAGSIAISNGLATAGSTSSTAIGSNSGNKGSQTATGAGAMALGGSYASGVDSFAAAIADNTSSYGATGANSVAIGYLAKATGADSIAIGEANTASAQSATAIGGGSNTASAAYSYALGWQASTPIIGKYSYASGQFAAAGDAQTGTTVLRAATTDATATILTTDNSTPGTTDQVILPNNSAYAFSGIIVARQQAAGGTASAAWKVEGLIRREANAASTVLVNSALTVIDNTPGWALAVSADTTNGGLRVQVTGAAATNIRWVATIQTSEVTYA